LASSPTNTVTSDMAYAPFGERYAVLGGAGGNFAGMESQFSSNEYRTQYRSYHSIQSRWLTPDPAGLAAADLSNPQSLNRYAYVLNNPLNYADPLGLYCVYLNDSGKAVESIDSDSDSGECAGGGGYWIQGDYGGGSWININVDAGTVTGLGYDPNGNSEWSVAGAMGSNAWGAWTQTFNSPGMNGMMEPSGSSNVVRFDPSTYQLPIGGAPFLFVHNAANNSSKGQQWQPAKSATNYWACYLNEYGSQWKNLSFGDLLKMIAIGSAAAQIPDLARLGFKISGGRAVSMGAARTVGWTMVITGGAVMVTEGARTQAVCNARTGYRP
jgi:RHS repeat-associated protein